MKIGLIDVDGHNFPNLALMKLSAWHKAQGDTVEWWWGFGQYNMVYMSKVFDNTYSPDIPEPINTQEVIKGGTGYGLDNKLPEEVEHMYPDYSLYPKFTKDTAYGFLTRGCPRGCNFCIVTEKEGRCSVKVADLSEWWNGQKNIKLLDPNITACKDRIALLQQLADSGAFVDFTQGIDARLLTEEVVFLINKINIKMLHFAWDYMNQSKSVIEGLMLYGKYGRLKERNRRVYVLTNFDTTMEDNLFRIYKLRELEFDPYVMIYDKPNAPKEIRDLQRWCNNKYIYRSCPDFTNYIRGKYHG